VFGDLIRIFGYPPTATVEVGTNSRIRSVFCFLDLNYRIALSNSEAKKLVQANDWEKQLNI
jgi:hypothetical protein